MVSDNKYRLPLAMTVLLTLLAALWAGLFRLGWQIPALRPTLPMTHGPLMVSGFLGTVIALERAVALREKWTYAGPILSAVGGLILIVDGASDMGPILIALGSLLFLVVSLTMVSRAPALYTATMALGSVSWLVGNVLWLAGWSIPEVVYWWAGFLILTIVGERLELSRIIQRGRISHPIFLASLGAAISGLLVLTVDYTTGVRIASLGFAALALWLFVFDLARRNVRRTGISRFIAVNLLFGFGWLFIGGVLGFIHAGITAGPTYDAMLHTLFIGFVLSMIFAHALIIVPALSGLPVPYHKLLYGPVVLLQLGLSMRIIGDLGLWRALRLWGGMLNVIAVLWFMFMLAALTALELRSRKKRDESAAVKSG